MQKLQTAQMGFLRSVNGCKRLDETRNEDTRKSFGVFSLNDGIESYRQDSLEYVEKVNEG
jgi:hypothetical protein